MNKLISVFALMLLAFNANANKNDKVLKIDSALSKVEWSATKKIGSGHNGEVPVKEGSVTMKKDQLVAGEIVIDLNGMTVSDIPKDNKDNAKLVDHLKAADFFDVSKYPQAKLVIKSSTLKSPGQYEVVADLTIKDVTLPVTLPVSVTHDKNISTATGKLTIDRTKYGIKYGSANFFKLAADRTINDNFELSFKVTAK